MHLLKTQLKPPSIPSDVSLGRCVHSDLGGYLGLEKQQFALLIVWGPNKSISGHDLDLISFYEKMMGSFISSTGSAKPFRGDRARNGESDHCGGDTGTISSQPTILQKEEFGWASRALLWNTHLSKITRSTYVLEGLHK
ncbi:uncharacterized protein LOC130140515 [Syzygium oleosum]|uniref:uncharacterized protein LOC130140515 n=1 Tax=Syzygium oleosum TaxID=219896 RepID=UPI0024B8E0CE|nr:uncharacterized protein LOC130140515 [Syzygium oleosum]